MGELTSGRSFMTYTDAWPHSIKDLVVFGNKNIEHGTN